MRAERVHTCEASGRVNCRECTKAGTLAALTLLQGRPSLEFISLDISAHQGFIKEISENRGTLHILSVVFRTTLTCIPKYYLFIKRFMNYFFLLLAPKKTLKRQKYHKMKNQMSRVYPGVG